MTKRCSKKYLAALGCGLFALSGLLSCLFYTSLALLFVFGAVAGIGIGLVVPIAPSLVAEYFSGERQKRVMGWQSGAASVGAMLMTFFGGLLAAYHWSCNYLVYLIALPGFVLSLVALPESAPSIAKRGKIQRSVLSMRVVQCACMSAATVTALFNLVPVNLSMYIEQRKLGTAAQAGTAAALLLFGGGARWCVLWPNSSEMETPCCGVRLRNADDGACVYHCSIEPSIYICGLSAKWQLYELRDATTDDRGNLSVRRTRRDGERMDYGGKQLGRFCYAAPYAFGTAVMGGRSAEPLGFGRKLSFYLSDYAMGVT